MFICESICMCMCVFEAYNVGRDCVFRKEKTTYANLS